MKVSEIRPQNICVHKTFD